MIKHVRDLSREERDGDSIYVSVVEADGKEYTISTLWRGQGKALGSYPREPDAKNLGIFQKEIEELYKLAGIDIDGEDTEIARNCETCLFTGSFGVPNDVIERHGFVFSEEEAKRLHDRTVNNFLQGAYQRHIEQLTQSR